MPWPTARGESPVHSPIVRPLDRADVDQVRRLALDNNMFEPDGMDDFDAMLDGFLDGSLPDHHWVVVATRRRGGSDQSGWVCESAAVNSRP